MKITIDGEVKPRAIVSRIRRSIGEDHFALIPTLVLLTNICEVYATLAVSTMSDIVQQVYATFVSVVNRHVPIVPRKYCATL